MSVQVSKIVITVGGKEIELSLADARELLQILDETLQPKKTEATKIVERIIEHHDHYRDWWPRPRWSITYQPTFTYSAGSAPADVRAIPVNATDVVASGGLTSRVMYINSTTAKVQS